MHDVALRRREVGLVVAEFLAMSGAAVTAGSVAVDKAEEAGKELPDDPIGLRDGGSRDRHATT